MANRSSIGHRPGFSPIILILIIVAAITAGIVGWRVWEASQISQNNPSNTNQAMEDPNKGYVVIKEWGIRFKPVAGLDGVIYEIRTISDGEAASFSTSALTSYGELCGVGPKGMSPLGVLGREKLAPQGSTVFTKQIGEYYYSYSTPQTSCSNDEVVGDLQQNILNSQFRPSIEKIEAVK